MEKHPAARLVAILWVVYEHKKCGQSLIVGFTNSVQQRNIMTLDLDSTRGSGGVCGTGNAFWSLLSKFITLPDPLLSEDLILVISSLVYLHLTSRNLITTKKQYSSFQKGQTKSTLKVLVQNALLGNMKSNGNRISKMGSARLTWVMQTGLGTP